MTREEYNAILDDLPAPTDAHMEFPDNPEILRETAKAMLLGFTYGQCGADRQVWFPKSVLAAGGSDPVFGTRLYVKRAWVARERLWWIWK